MAFRLDAPDGFQAASWFTGRAAKHRPEAREFQSHGRSKANKRTQKIQSHRSKADQEQAYLRMKRLRICLPRMVTFLFRNSGTMNNISSRMLRGSKGSNLVHGNSLALTLTTLNQCITHQYVASFFALLMMFTSATILPFRKSTSVAKSVAHRGSTI